MWTHPMYPYAKWTSIVKPELTGLVQPTEWLNKMALDLIENPNSSPSEEMQSEIPTWKLSNPYM